MKKVYWLKQKGQSSQKAAETTSFIQNLIFSDENISSETKRNKAALFEELVEAQKLKKYPQETPETFCCKITFVIFLLIRKFSYFY